MRDNQGHTLLSIFNRLIQVLICVLLVEKVLCIPIECAKCDYKYLLSTIRTKIESGSGNNFLFIKAIVIVINQKSSWTGL